jgi:phosphate/sulfate permease
MDAALGFPALVALIAIALLFDMLNGLHDAANSIATVVSTRVLPPQYAVAWAAFFNELDSLTERWVADHLRNANASKTRKRTRYS